MKYFIWWVQPTSPYYRHAIPREIIEISSLLSSSSSLGALDYMLGPSDVGEDFEHAVSAMLSLTPIAKDDEIEEDPEMLEEDPLEAIEYPFDLIMVDGIAVVNGELSYGEVGWLMKESSEEDPDKNRWDVSLGSLAVKDLLVVDS